MTTRYVFAGRLEAFKPRGGAVGAAVGVPAPAAAVGVNVLQRQDVEVEVIANDQTIAVLAIFAKRLKAAWDDAAGQANANDKWQRLENHFNLPELLEAVENGYVRTVPKQLKSLGLKEPLPNLPQEA